MKIKGWKRLGEEARGVLRSKGYRLLLGGLLLTPVVVIAGHIESVPYPTFTSGTVIKASEVNANFAYLDGLISSLDSGLGYLESALFVDTKNNVGVNTSVPAASLDVKGNLSAPLTGTVGVTKGSTTVTGVGTKFTTELAVGNAIKVGSEVFTVAAIASDTSLTLDSAHAAGAGSSTAYTDGDLLTVRNGDGVSKLVVDRGGSVATGGSLKVNGGGVFQQDSIVGLHLSGRDENGATRAWTFYNMSNYADLRPSLQVWQYLDSNNKNGACAGETGEICSPRLTIDEAGYVGVGTTSPDGQLHVATGPQWSSFNLGANIVVSGGRNNAIALLDSADANPWAVANWNGSFSVVKMPPLGDTTSTPMGIPFSIHPSGSVGINTTSPAYTLDVAGYVRATNVTVSSDRRLKTDITPLTDALEGIQCLQGVSYRWSDPTQSQDLQVGLIAQDVEECYPELVSTDPSGYKSVAYDRLVAPLIEATKAQQQELTRLRQDVARQQQRDLAQQKEITALEARLARLEASVRTGK